MYPQQERHYTYGVVKNPIRDALKAIMRKAPPKYVQGYDYSNLTDSQHSDLQAWVGMNLPNILYWSTAIGVIEAAEQLVEEAVANANIPPKESNEEPIRKKTKRRR